MISGLSRSRRVPRERESLGDTTLRPGSTCHPLFPVHPSCPAALFSPRLSLIVVSCSPPLSAAQQNIEFEDDEEEQDGEDRRAL